MALLVYPGVSVRVRKDGFSGPGRLSLGKKWWGQQSLPSSFVVMLGGRVNALGNFVFYRGCNVRVKPGAVLTIGSGYANDNVHIDCHEAVTIGHSVAIAKDVVIMDSDHHSIEGGKLTSPVVIGDHVWVGTRAMILKGVTIGDGAVVAAGAIVTKDVPAGMLVAGIPATPIRPIKWSL